jgi:hypothetical protein
LDGDSSAARSFIANFFKSNAAGSNLYRGEALRQEIRLTEPMVLCSILKWCWSRIPGGVVSWPVYEAFKIGEQESKLARNSFNTFLPMATTSIARRDIIVDFFELLAAVAAHGKMNGLGGRKLSRLAGWWAFELSDDGKGFEGGYKSWTTAADASSHLFFAYLRGHSAEADPSMRLIERIPRSLQALLAQTEYPPEPPTLMQRSTPRVVMIVDTVSPTPFALLRRAKHFEYRERDRVLRELSDYEDPVDALTYECKRVLHAISTINSSAAIGSRSGHFSNSDESWSAFSNMGFTDSPSSPASPSVNGAGSRGASALGSTPRSRNADFGRPMTPSWGDFLSSGFSDDDKHSGTSTLLLPPDKVLPPIGSRAQTPSSNSNFGKGSGDDDLAPGELAAITNVELDDAFWWVWMTSLSGEEPNERKAVFGRCALIETTIMNGRWLIMEEQVKGASPDPIQGAEILEKKSRFGFTKRGRLGGRKQSSKQPAPSPKPVLTHTVSTTPSMTSIGPDQQAKIRVAAAALARKESSIQDEGATRRGRADDTASMKTNSVLTLGLSNEAGPAMKWANSYDKSALRAQYLGDNFAGSGASRDDLAKRASSINTTGDAASTIRGPPAPPLSPDATTFSQSTAQRDLPALPATEQAAPVIATMSPPNEDVLRPSPPKSPESHVAAPVVETPLDENSPGDYPTPDSVQAEASDPMAKEVGITAMPQVGRKPVPRSDNIRDHPAFRQPSMDQPRASESHYVSPAILAAQKALEGNSRTNLESQQNQSMPRKQVAGGSNAFRKLFGGKSKENDKTNRRSIDIQNQPSLAPPSESSLGRRISIMRKKSGPSASVPKQFPPKPTQSASISEAAPEAQYGPPMPVSPPLHNGSQANISRTDTRDNEHANAEFSRFDQGPMQDMPATVPRDSIDDDRDAASEVPESPTAKRYNTRAAAMLDPNFQPPATYEPHAAPLERSETPFNDAASERSVEDQPPATQDRWAQIRENAARRAARASEEQSRPRTEDEGETSGEESKLPKSLLTAMENDE